ncbi:hypothetical protein V2J09_018982 [Rumex salicifolius]
MKCLFSFKDTSWWKRRRSAPDLLNRGGNSGGESSTGDRGARSSGSGISPRGINELYEEKGRNLRVFTYSELRLATSDFNRLLKIGEGGFGSVYKGKVKIRPGSGEHSEPLVAIKKLRKDGYQGHKQWLAEVQFLGVVEHPNLVKLIGYCAVDGERGIQRLLVYEYMPNRSLEDHLFNKAYSVLPWQKRLNILLGAAQGLAYLHEELEVQVIFRDFKTSNVLLNEDFEAKLSDFGLAREGPSAGRSHVSTAVVGTHGYAAPDYIETGHLTSKSDVWSFGVVLYEILTGRRSLERSHPKSEQKLLEWVQQYPPNSKKFSRIMDPRLEDQYSLSAAKKIAKLADQCLVQKAKDRPKMSQVVEELKQIIVQETEDEENVQANCTDSSESDQAESVDVGLSQTKVTTESARRRLAHLAKLGDHVDGFSRKKFMIMQRANV